MLHSTANDTLSFTAAYLHSRIKSAFILSSQNVQLQGNALPNSPEWTVDSTYSRVVQAVRFVRAHAKEWNIAPDRIIIAGQSNGSILVSEYLRRKVQAQPVLGAGLLYVAPPDAAQPHDTPVYLAAAADDALTIDDTITMFSRWKAAGKPAELHAYQSGRHGFRSPETSGRASWIADFINWAEALSAKQQ